METGAVYYFPPSTERVVTHDGMASVIIIIIQDNNVWLFRSSAQLTNIVSRGNRNGSWKRIRGIAGYFVWGGDYHQWAWGVD